MALRLLCPPTLNSLKQGLEEHDLSPGIIWMDLDKIATKGFSSLSHFPIVLGAVYWWLVCCYGHLREMHWPKRPFVAILSHSGPVLGYNDCTTSSKVHPMS